MDEMIAINLKSQSSITVTFSPQKGQNLILSDTTPMENSPSYMLNQIAFP